MTKKQLSNNVFNEISKFKKIEWDENRQGAYFYTGSIQRIL